METTRTMNEQWSGHFARLIILMINEQETNRNDFWERKIFLDFSFPEIWQSAFILGGYILF